LFIPDPDPDFLPIPDLGSRDQMGTGSQIPDPDPQPRKKVSPVFDVAHVLENGHHHRPDLLDLDHRETLH